MNDCNCKLWMGLTLAQKVVWQRSRSRSKHQRSGNSLKAQPEVVRDFLRQPSQSFDVVLRSCFAVLVHCCVMPLPLSMSLPVAPMKAAAQKSWIQKARPQLLLSSSTRCRRSTCAFWQSAMRPKPSSNCITMPYMVSWALPRSAC